MYGFYAFIFLLGNELSFGIQQSQQNTHTHPLAHCKIHPVKMSHLMNETRGQRGKNENTKEKFITNQKENTK